MSFFRYSPAVTKGLKKVTNMFQIGLFPHKKVKFAHFSTKQVCNVKKKNFQCLITSVNGKPFGTGLVRHCPQGIFSPFLTFLRAIFSRPFRLSLAPTICPWVSEDAVADEVRLLRLNECRLLKPCCFIFLLLFFFFLCLHRSNLLPKVTTTRHTSQCTEHTRDMNTM